MTYTIGNVLDVLPTLDAGRFQCCVTSPPYWGLRDYGHDDQLGLEPTPAEYVANMVRVFAEVRRVLRDDGVLWLNVGDSYAGARGGPQGAGGQMADRSVAKSRCREVGITRVADGCKPKDLVGIPWMLAFALRADGWYLRSDIIWAKPSPMPESVTDRPTRAHEYVFLLSKRASYYYDADAIAEPTTEDPGERRIGGDKTTAATLGGKDSSALRAVKDTRNARSVWTIASQPFAGAHFATMPPKLAERCILAGSRIGDEVLDPFLGSGTVGMVAEALGRRWHGVELNPKYEEIIRQRTAQQGLFGRTP